jgi:predicted transcriptional regulator YdeE
MAGLHRSHRLPRDRQDAYRDVAAQWRAFVSIARDLPHLPPHRGYGIGLCMADGATALDYFCGFVVAGRDRVPAPLTALAIAPLHCAVFPHHDHVSHLRATIELIFATVLPMAGIEPANDVAGAPEFIQRYSDSFDPATGLGGIEVLVPIKA